MVKYPNDYQDRRGGLECPVLQVVLLEMERLFASQDAVQGWVSTLVQWVCVPLIAHKNVDVHCVLKNEFCLQTLLDEMNRRFAP